jgi:hypothetical protein
MYQIMPLVILVSRLGAGMASASAILLGGFGETPWSNAG